MLTDLNNTGPIEDTFNEYDVTIVGAGAAGITLALKLSDEGKKIALIEAGGREYSEVSQKIYSAKTVGDPYFELDEARLRYFGGSTNHWAGLCRTFEREDFNREYMGEEYKWPINFEDLDYYRADACEILEISSEFQDSNSSESEVESISFHTSPVRFSSKYFDVLVANPLVHVFLNSNLIDVTHSGNRLTSIKVASYNENVSYINSQNFIFAMGGIENSRYLLWLKSKYGNSFISDVSPIGRYWMEHPHFTLGQAIVDKRKVSEYYYSISSQAQIDKGILNCGFRVEHLSDKGTRALIRDVLCLAPTLGRSLARAYDGHKLICGVRFRAAWEQSPESRNRITLDSDYDRFGIPKPILNWTKSKLDRKTLVSSIALFNEWLLRIEGGRIQLDNWVLNHEDYPVNGKELAGYHHMGGTRMHVSEQYGVVDQNCKVYGSSNLYIAGSSIFTTGGHNNPTLPIVQFALRLAEYLLR